MVEQRETASARIAPRTHWLRHPTVGVRGHVSGAYAGVASASCSKRHITLPLPLLGKASTNDTKRGTL